MRSVCFLLLLGALAWTQTAWAQVGHMKITGGHCIIQPGTYLVSEGDVVVAASATLTLQYPSTLLTPTGVTVEADGVIEGAGTLSGDLDNGGSVLANGGSGTQLEVTGSVTNAGQIRASSDTALAVTGTFTNSASGVLDLIFSPSALPASLTGSGETITATTLPAATPPVLGTGILTFEIEAFPGNAYRIERTTDLSDPASWVQLGTLLYPQTRSTLIIQDTTTLLESTQAVFYRYQILDPDADRGRGASPVVREKQCWLLLRRNMLSAYTRSV